MNRDEGRKLLSEVFDCGAYHACLEMDSLVDDLIRIAEDSGVNVEILNKMMKKKKEAMNTQDYSCGYSVLDQFFKKTIPTWEVYQYWKKHWINIWIDKNFDVEFDKSNKKVKKPKGELKRFSVYKGDERDNKSYYMCKSAKWLAYKLYGVESKGIPFDENKTQKGWCIEFIMPHPNTWFVSNHEGHAIYTIVEFTKPKPGRVSNLVFTKITGD